jgi:predicted RNA-binding protein YlqC (UPF0109 family)
MTQQGHPRLERGSKYTINIHMKDAILFILKRIVDNPDDVSVEEQTEQERTIFVIHVHPSDMGKVIGKQGRIIMAIRDLVKLMATKENKFVDVTIAESEVKPVEA